MCTVHWLHSSITLGLTWSFYLLPQNCLQLLEVLLLCGDECDLSFLGDYIQCVHQLCEAIGTCSHPVKQEMMAAYCYFFHIHRIDSLQSQLNWETIQMFAHMCTYTWSDAHNVTHLNLPTPYRSVVVFIQGAILARIPTASFYFESCLPDSPPVFNCITFWGCQLNVLLLHFFTLNESNKPIPLCFSSSSVSLLFLTSSAKGKWVTTTRWSSI